MPPITFDYFLYPPLQQCMNKDGQRLWIVMSRHKGRKFFRQNPTVRQAPFCHQPHFYVGSQFSKYHFIALYPFVVPSHSERFSL